MKAPAFQFYPDDFIGGTVALSTEEVGAYIRLLCYQWGQGQIPESKEALARVAGCEVTKEVIAKFPGGRNPRLEAEREKQARYRELQASKGRASAEARFNRGSTAVQPRPVDIRLEPKGNSPSPSPSPSPISNLQSPTPSPSGNGVAGNGIGPTATILKAIGAVYKRKPSALPCHDEEREALEIAKRPEWQAELEKILAWEKSVTPEHRRYQVPTTMLRLLQQWTGCLDKANGLNGHEWAGMTVSQALEHYKKNVGGSDSAFMMLWQQFEDSRK